MDNAQSRGVTSYIKENNYIKVSFVSQVSSGSMRTTKFWDYLVSILIIISAVVIDAKSLRNLVREEDGDGLVMIPYNPYHGEDSPKFYVSTTYV